MTEGNNSDARSLKFFHTDNLMPDLKGRAVRGGAVTMIAQACRFVLNIGGIYALARMLSTDQFGLIDMVVAVTGLVSLVKDLGLAMATVQREEITHEQISTLFWVNVALSTALMLVIAALAPIIAWFYGKPELVWITVVLSLGVIFGGLAIQQQALLRRQMRFKSLAVVNVAGVAIGVTAGIVSAWRGAGYWALVIQILAREFSIAAGYWIASGWRPGRPARNTGVRSMLSFGGNLTGYNIVNYFARNMDKVLIGSTWGAGPLGVYKKAYDLLLLPLHQITAPVSSVAIPTLSRLKNNPERYRQAYLKMLKSMCMVAMPLIAFMIATSDWLVLAILGPQWTEAGRIFAVLGIVALMQTVTRTAGWLFVSQGRTKHMFQWGIVGTTISIVSFIAGLPWGGFGVAVAYTIGMAVQTPLLLLFISREGPVHFVDFFEASIFPVGISMLILVILVVVRKWLFAPQPLLGIVVFFAVAVAITLLICLFSPRERAALKDIKAVLANRKP